MKKMMMVLGMLFLIAGCSESEKKNIGHDTFVLHYQYVEPDADEPFEGERTFHYDSGEIKNKVTYNNGYPEVVETFYHSQQKRAKLVFADGGKGDMKTHIEWYENGQKKFKSANEVTREWYKNGQLKMEAHYTSGGVLHGLTKVWYEDGTLKGKENYVQGELDGERMEWDEDGEQILSEVYRKGEPISENGS